VSDKISFSFEVVIAYVIPGFIALEALKSTNSDLANFFVDTSADDDIGRWTILFALSLLTGMIVSIVRASLLDRSFRFSLRLFESMPDQYNRVEPIEPNYERLSAPGKLEVFQEIQSGLRRPYEFYGNALLSGLLFSILTPLPANQTLWLSFYLIAGCSLYTATRKTYFRYMKALEELNRAVEPQSSVHNHHSRSR